jgi:CRISPR/Cas system CMR subunit Cmr4 (Cas7 group RAMP superfamily)
MLMTPTHLGNGEADGPIGMSLLRDPLTETQVLLTGASIAGALRNYLREVEHGYGVKIEDDQAPGSPVVQLFGGRRGDDSGAQSLLIVDDARSETAPIEVRDGVRIDPATGTAKEGAKFDLELLQAGTTFPLRFELLIPEGKTAALKRALARALQGLQKGEITLGARKRRGFGCCQVKRWRVVSYDLSTPDGLLSWLSQEENTAEEGEDIASLLGVSVGNADVRHRFTLDAEFWLDGSLLIRADSRCGADAGHLYSPRPGGQAVPILPGTSLAGALRHRALRIANTLAPDGDGSNLVERMFGSSLKEREDREEEQSTQDSPARSEGDKPLTASRVIVRETVIEGTKPLVQSRVEIDRFTGGAYPTALFSEEVLFGGPGSSVRVFAELRNPQDHEVGLLLLLLKDLWTGDLAIGGERSVGRGRLRGKNAELRWHNTQGNETWDLTQVGNNVHFTGHVERLEACVKALQPALKRGR